MSVQGLFPLTHCHSSSLNGCSRDLQGLFDTHSMAFTWTHKCSESVSSLLKDILVHSQVFRTCSVLTQIRTFSWSHYGELHSIMTQRWSCALNGCSHSLKSGHVHTVGVQGYSHSLIGIHKHSMSVQGVFNTHSLSFMSTQWVFRECSRCVQYSLKGIHMHSIVLRGC
jgi:hypothetical protein